MVKALHLVSDHKTVFITFQNLNFVSDFYCKNRFIPDRAQVSSMLPPVDDNYRLTKFVQAKNFHLTTLKGFDGIK